jgi:hypothetical protein
VIVDYYRNHRIDVNAVKLTIAGTPRFARCGCSRGTSRTSRS